MNGRNMNTLNIDEILVLDWQGFSASQIINMDLEAFDKLYYENTGKFQGLLDKANALLDKQEALGIKTISCHDGNYPARLKAIKNEAPVLIHCLGDQELLNMEKSVAVIGARAADKEGLNAAYKLGRQYAENGYVIVSGLALGCDKSAHEGCLSVGGKTIAIVGSGLDIVHPRENAELQQRIIDNGGLILSEQTIGVKANPTRLVARNRLQAALSEAVILAQCPAHSGSLHTMRFARKYHKPCLAATFPRRTEANAGNYNLIDNNLAVPKVME